MGFLQRVLARLWHWALTLGLAMGLSACLSTVDPAFEPGTGEDLGPVFSYNAFHPKHYETNLNRMVFNRRANGTYDMVMVEADPNMPGQEGSMAMPLVRSVEFRRFGARGTDAVYLVQIWLENRDSQPEGYMVFLLDLLVDGTGRVGAMKCADPPVQALAADLGLTLECVPPRPYNTAEQYQVGVAASPGPSAINSFLAEGLAKGLVAWEDELDLLFIYDLGPD
jgi:hypothetical protein